MIYLVHTFIHSYIHTFIHIAKCLVSLFFSVYCKKHHNIKMMNLSRYVTKLCTPAYVYLVISAITIVMMIVQNVGNTHSYCLGNVQCNNTNTIMIFTIKIVYTLFWTWVLDLICKAGWTPVSWVLVILPLLLMFVMLSAYILSASNGMPQMLYPFQ